MTMWGPREVGQEQWSEGAGGLLNQVISLNFPIAWKGDKGIVHIYGTCISRSGV